VNSKLNARITQLKKDHIHGASWLSLKALNIMNLAIVESQMDTVARFLQELKMTSMEIATARPGMVSISNYVSRYINEITAFSLEDHQLNEFKYIAKLKLKQLIKYNKEAPIKAAKLAAQLIKEEDTIIICSYSSTICNLLKFASKIYKKLHVIIVESRYDGFDYGEMSLKELRKFGIPAHVIPQNKLGSYMDKVTTAFIGSDTIFADGSVINGAPSLLLAETATKSKVKVYSVCEIAKISPEKARTFSQLEPGLELIPSNLITGIVTDIGLVDRENISDLERYWTKPL
jgi:translation initiation factor 2B subunit (eIF-2B alpha/beta/delta family)